MLLANRDQTKEANFLGLELKVVGVEVDLCNHLDSMPRKYSKSI